MTPDPHEPLRRRALARVAVALLVLELLFCAAAQSSTDAERYSSAIARYMIDRGAPGARVVTDPEYRAAVVDAAIAAGDLYDLPPPLLLSMAYYESSYKVTAVGARGEIGLLQTGDQARTVCACDDLQTPDGQIMCGACWLRRAHDACGTLEGALTMYAVGECSSSSPRVVQLVERRLATSRTLSRELP